MPGVLQQLADQGLTPGCVIDVGAADGTRPLYETFPAARQLLVEPLVEFEPALRQLCEPDNFEYVLAVAGAESGRATLHVHPDLEGSSLLRENEGPDVNGTPREVPVVTLDALVEQRNLPGPYLLKVDVQGGELRVLDGASRVLEQTEAVLLETTLFAVFEDGPQLLEVLNYMSDRGFVLYDIFGQLYRPLDNALIQTDLVFVRESGPLRQHHFYATAEQRKAQFGQ